MSFIWKNYCTGDVGLPPGKQSHHDNILMCAHKHVNNIEILKFLSINQHNQCVLMPDYTGDTQVDTQHSTRVSESLQRTPTSRFSAADEAAEA